MKQRYIRFFPARLDELNQWFTPRECCAYLRLCRHYCQDGGLPDDDKKLAAYAELKLDKWREMRAKLELYKICYAAEGRWIDPDQDQNINVQQRATQRGANGGRAKAEKERAARLLNGGGHA